MVEFKDMVKALAKDGDTIASEITGTDAHLLHMAIGVSGEVGELIDAIKKFVIYRKDLDLPNVIEELGDIEFYIEGIRQGLGISRQETLDATIAKLSKRYEDMTYSDKSAHDRKDKV